MMCARDPLLAEEQKWLAEAAEPELLVRRAARPPAGVPVIPPSVEITSGRKPPDSRGLSFSLPQELSRFPSQSRMQILRH